MARNEEQKDFAVSAEQRISEVRNDGVRTAARALVVGDDPEQRIATASSTLIASVMYQARLAGCGV